MKIGKYLLSFFFLAILFVFVSPKSALAANYQLSGTVTNNSSVAVGGATIHIYNAGTTTDVVPPVNTASDSGNYIFSSVPSGTYDIVVNPASGSGYSSAIALSQSISADTVLNFILTPAGTSILQGTITDRSGTALSGQRVTIYTADGNTELGHSTTNSSGNYSVNVTSGTYLVTITATNNSLSLHAPQTYFLNVNNFNLTQDTTFNVSLPVQQVTLHLVDQSGQAVSGVQLTSSSGGTNTNLNIGGSVANVSGRSSYGVNGIGPVSDNSGNMTLWLFTNDPSSPYTFTLTPSNSSDFATTTFNNINITGDNTVTEQMNPAVTLSGHVYDRSGTALASQFVTIYDASGNQLGQSRTNSSGVYTIKVTPGTGYNLQVTATNNSLTLTAPQSYFLSENNYSLTQDTTLDITLPLKQVTLHVVDSSGASISGIQLTNTSGGNASNLSIGGGITDATGRASYGNPTGPVTNNSGNVVLWLFANDASSPYSFTLTPPHGSEYLTTTSSNNNISDDTTLNIQMQASDVTLQGKITDSSGTDLAGQQVTIYSPDGSTEYGNSVTDSSGSYSVTVAPGTYLITISAINNSFSVNAPQTYNMNINNYALMQNTTLNFALPIQQVKFHLVDQSGNSVSGVQLTSMTGGNTSNLTIGGINNVTGRSSYGNPTGPVTDNSGDMTLWLFANDSSTPYSFTFTPPNGSIYDTFVLNNITINTDPVQNELVSLQYNHATPVTTASLSPSPFSDGMYADPTTVTLSATAASGYTVANTYYTIDGGAVQTYNNTPFTVTGAGSHTITYWSVDNSGVQETANTKTFAITEAYSLTGTVYNDADQNGVQGSGEQGYAGATVTLNTGQSTTTDSNGNYTFPNLESGTYTETLTVPSGYVPTTTNPVSVPLAANTTENFGIAQPTSLATAINAGGDTEGSFAADTDFSGGSTFSTSASVDTSGVTNPAPEAVYQSVRYGNFTYTIPDLTANGTYTLQLHFSEPYWGTSQAGGGGVGSRVFNVSVNGTQELSDFDVYQAAGGANKAVMEQIPATADSNGNITVTFTNVVDNAMVSGIAVYNGTLTSPTPTPSPTPVTSLAISAGGSGTDNFVADTDYTGGTTYSSSASVDTSGVTDPAPEAVYQNSRYGNFTYTIPTYSPDTNYKVRLDFNEPYWQSAGSREFNVSINGTQVLNNFDVYQTAGGQNKAVAEQFNTTSDSNGFITIQFSSVVDNAIVSGIEVSQQ